MAKRTSVEDDLAALKALAGEPANPQLAAKLTAALRSRVNLVVARAAGIVLQLKRTGPAGELIAAFDRFLNDDKYTDKGCTALTAIAKTLYELGEPSAEAAFVAGVKHVQMEGSFGPPVDVATELRGVCGLGLVRIGHRDQMIHLADLLADPEPQVRRFAARGLAYSERPEAALLLRFKLHGGDREVEVVTECMNAFVRLDPNRAPEFLSDFLDDSDPDIRTSAALALGESRMAEAFELLKARVPMERDADVRRTILLSVALLRLPLANDWLIARIADGSPQDASGAIEALAMYRRDSAMSDRVKTTAGARKESDVQRALAKHFMA